MSNCYRHLWREWSSYRTWQTGQKGIKWKFLERFRQCVKCGKKVVPFMLGKA